MFLLELVLQAILPIVLFSIPKVRKSPSGLFWSAVVLIVGTVLSRINVSLVGPLAPVGIPHLAQVAYFPHWMEFAVTIGLVSGGVVLFALAVRFLPIFPETETH